VPTQVILPSSRTPAATDSPGQVSDEPLTLTVTAEATVGAAAANIAAAGAGTGRVVVVQCHALDAGGIRVNFGADATATSFYVPSGGFRVFPTEQRVSAIRADGTDVRVSVAVGTVA
jgi:hypothetical protein